MDEPLTARTATSSGRLTLKQLFKSEIANNTIMPGVNQTINNKLQSRRNLQLLLSSERQLVLIALSWWAAAQTTAFSRFNTALTGRGFSSPGPAPASVSRGLPAFPHAYLHQTENGERERQSEGMCENITITHSTEGSETLRRRRLASAPREHGGLLSESAFRAVYLCKLHKNTFEQGHQKKTKIK